MTIHIEQVCPVCKGRELDNFLELTQLPVYCNLLWDSSKEAIDCQKGDINLSLCLDCGFIFNTSFDPELLSYSQKYENSLHYSKRFQMYADELADRLIEKHDLKRKAILEIGCGKGDFLLSLCQKGNNTGIGFDKSYVPKNQHSSNDLTFIQDFYSAKYKNYDFDFLCCRQVLEHLQEPLSLLYDIAEVNDCRMPLKYFFEVPNSAFIFEQLSIWDIIYEHCNYFTKDSLKYVFEKLGFRVNAVSEEFGGQFIGIEGEFLSVNSALKAPEPACSDSLKTLLNSFQIAFKGKVEEFQANLRKFSQAGKAVAIWGSGSKGVTFLNLLGSIDNSVTCAVDINPQKQGKFIPGTGHPIVPPNHLASNPVDVVIVMNPQYRQEIQSMLAEMLLFPEIIIV